MKSFKDIFIVESFDLIDKPNKLSPAKGKELLVGYLSQKYSDPEKLYDYLVNSFEKLILFKYTEGSEEYIVFFGNKVGEKYFEIHFNNIKHIDNFLDLGVLKTSQNLLSFLFSIIYHYGLCYGRDIEILSDEKNNRTNLYIKIIEKIIKKYNLNYSYETNTNYLYIKHKPRLLFTEQFIH